VDGAITVSLVFRFDVKGLIYTAHAAARYRTVNSALVATPWEGPSPYWRGRITDIVYELAR
jgi:hypothetical protein